MGEVDAAGRVGPPSDGDAPRPVPRVAAGRSGGPPAWFAVSKRIFELVGTLLGYAIVLLGALIVASVFVWVLVALWRLIL